ncbi:dual specificity tyrosine-phosphorylation-regulated kinase 4-like [Gadus macrocephalus]|uniref:dual specificity tyrosine-phosphorylation-regulated kinase 4-like n=1 Tax=Gadus macrocephalus TaxID=80720 RepID=UPI0028CB695F|nr:dual specificity tyrosine-phosphorylation-regulated kinase 4-like [Gadus macrocephalus]
MTKYEQKEIKGYNDIWFLGLHAMKIQGSRHTGIFNHGFDNEQYFYEQGVYGQVLKCFDHQHNELVALKLLRNQPRYHRLGKEERRILQLLRDKDPEDDHHVVHMKDFLVFRKHICISFELLGSDMHAMQTKKGESVSYVRKCAYPILKCLQLLKRENIMHSDLKLANMVMSDKDPNTLKVIDFGLSLVQDEPRYYSRIQTQSIRAPEVTLGLLCTTAIDMWSFGCCLIELLIGREAFYGDEEYEQLTRTIEILGMPPEELVALSSQRNVFFDERGTLKYIRVNNSGEKLLPGSKRLESLLGTSDPDLLDFIKRCLDWDSSKRMTPGQALEHAWMMKTSLGCMSPTPGNPPKTVMLKTLAAGTTQHLKPDEATGSQPQTMDQGEMDKLGKHGRTLRPLTSELDPLLPPIGATAPAPPPRGKRVTVTPDGGADKRDAGATKPAGQAACSRVSPIGAAAPSPPPRGKRSTVTTDSGAASLLKKNYNLNPTM